MKNLVKNIGDLIESTADLAGRAVRPWKGPVLSSPIAGCSIAFNGATAVRPWKDRCRTLLGDVGNASMGPRR